MELAVGNLTTKKELLTAIFSIIERATSREQLREIELAIVDAVLVSNPRVYRQLDNGNWVLRNPPKRVKSAEVLPFEPVS